MLHFVIIAHPYCTACRLPFSISGTDIAVRHEIHCLVSYCILLMQVVGANRWSTVSSVGHTFICAYQRASDGALDGLSFG